MIRTDLTPFPAQRYPSLLEERGQRQRRLVAVAAAIAAVAHVPVIAPHLGEAPYMGLLFIVLTLACLVLAGAALIQDTGAVYALAVLTCGLAVLG
jgi:peptidoglycan/LPS O-acetylase OafA/YrhL